MGGVLCPFPFEAHDTVTKLDIRPSSLASTEEETSGGTEDSSTMTFTYQCRYVICTWHSHFKISLSNGEAVHAFRFNLEKSPESEKKAMHQPLVSRARLCCEVECASPATNRRWRPVTLSA
jgi:hypothetical protein